MGMTSCFNFLPILHVLPMKTNRPSQMAYSVSLLPVPQPTSTYPHATGRPPCWTASTPSGARCLAGLGTVRAGDLWVSWEWQGEARGGEQRIMLYN